MTRYVIVRKSDGFFVASVRKNPNGRSYTKYLQYVKTFASKNEAQRNCCPESEIVVDMEDYLK